VTTRSRWLALGAMATVVAGAVFFRFYDLATNPGGLYTDEAAEGLDALRLLHQPGFHPDWMVWFQSDGGREALFAYVVAAAFHFFGETALVLRATAAAFGVAGVLAIGWLGRRFGMWTGVVAAAWAAGSLWLICVSRDGMRNTIVPLFGAVALIALVHWAARPGRLSALLAGAVTSLAALYTYQPLKMLPLLVIVWIVWLRHADRARYNDLRAGLLPFAAAFLVVAAPMIAVAVTDPISYFGRAAAVSTFNPDVAADASLPIHILKTIAMFGFTGDGNGRHDVAFLPLLPLPLVALAALGVWRLWRNRRDPSHSLILLSLLIFMIPPLVATEGWSPHFLRVLGLAAPLGVTIGLGAAELVEQVRSRSSRPGSGPGSGLAVGPIAAIAAVAVVLAGVAVWSGWTYLSRPVADRYTAYSYEVSAASQYAADHPGSVVIIDCNSGTDIEFLQWANPPTIVSPGTQIDHPNAYSAIVAMTKEDLTNAVGAELGDRAQPVAWDPSGKPVVWAVAPR
jgi:4-amino-4-deoxy-L-arabinose transferase-like glycosyltransferase